MNAAFYAQQGHRLKDHGPIFATGFQYVAIILLVLGAIAGWLISPGFRGIGLAIIAASALPMAIVVIQVVRLRRKIGKAELVLPHESMPLGLHVNATYQRPLRGGAAVREVVARLQCQEELERGTGKNRRTYKKVVYDQPLEPVTTPMMEALRIQIPFRVPEEGPASFQAQRAEIQWWVRLHLRMQGCPDTRSSFQLIILPVVVER